MGRDLELVETEGIVSKPLSNHPDIFLCKMGISEDAPVFYAMENHLGPEYPRDCAYNAACTGKFFIHNFSITDPALLQAAKDMGMTLIDVNGNLAKHPDFAQIVDFVESHGLTPKWFPEYQLTDIGSIL